MGKLLVSFGLIGIILYVSIVLGLVGLSLYGLVVAFHASILLGFIALVVEPLPLVIGLCKVFAGLDIAVKIVEYFSK